MFQLCKTFEGWIPDKMLIERKYDGTNAVWGEGEFINRRGNNITAQFPEIKIEFKGILLGEIVILNENGKDNFNKILKRRTTDELKIELLSEEIPATFIAYDVLEFEGEDLRGLPLWERIQYLNKIEGENWDLPERVLLVKPKEALEIARKLGWEGIIIKDLNAAYKSNRNRNYQKLKCFEEATCPFVRWEEGESRGTVAIVTFRGVEQRVGVGGEKDAELVREGKVKEIEVQYLELNESGLLRQPTCKRVII